MNKEAVYAYLASRRIPYEATGHGAVFRMTDLPSVPLPYPDADAKNLFVRGGKKERYYLITVKGDKRVDLKAFRRRHGTRALSFACADGLRALLGLTPGSVTPPGVLNDTERRLHMIATVWSFLLAFVHLGLHWQTFVSMFKAQAEKMRLAAPAVYRIVLRLLRLVALALCVYGITAFCRRSLWNEMFLLTEFKFMDFEEPPLSFFIDHAAISVLVVTAGFYLKKLAVRCALR